jgi:hypothetical protein
MAKAKKKVTKKAGSTAGDDKFHKIIIIGDDGQFYALEKSQWMVDANVVQDAGTKSSVKVLKDAGLVRDQQVGTRRMYRLDPAGIGAIRSYFDHLWQQALAAFKDAAEQLDEETS